MPARESPPRDPSPDAGPPARSPLKGGEWRGFQGAPADAGLEETAPTRPEEAAPLLPHRRSAGIWVLALLDIILATCCGLAVHYLLQVRAYEIEKSFDVAEELEIALAGLALMTWAAALAGAGFVLSAIAVWSVRRAGWFFALAWATIMTLTGLGAFYGLPAFAYLVAASTRSRFRPPEVD